MSWERVGDSIIISSTGLGCGDISVTMTYLKNKEELNMPDDSICGNIYVDVYYHFSFCKTFPIEGIEIQGPECVAVGDKVTYAIEEILPINFEAGTDGYAWNVPNDWQQVKKSKQGNIVTYIVGSIPTDPISVRVGNYNTDTSATRYKTLLPRATAPQVVSAPESCLSAKIRQVEIGFIKSVYPHKWVLSNHDWNVIGDTVVGDTIFVKVDIGVSAGVVAMQVCGVCDTVYASVDITRAIGAGATEIGDVMCATEGVVTPYSIYPAPNQNITWELPAGWDYDPFNSNSSKVRVTPRKGEAEAGWIVVQATQCPNAKDSVWIDMKPDSLNPIQLVGEDEHCLRIGHSYTFTSTSVRHGQNYRWAFPDGWTFNNPNDTLITQLLEGQTLTITATPTTEVGTGEIRLYVYGKGNCDEGQYVSYNVNFVPMSLGTITREDEGSCINLNMEDMIGYRVPTQRSVLFIWDIPRGWSIQDNDSVWFIRAITDGVYGKNLRVAVYSTNECGTSDTAVLLQDVVGIQEGLYIYPESLLVPEYNYDVEPNEDLEYPKIGEQQIGYSIRMNFVPDEQPSTEWWENRIGEDAWHNGIWDDNTVYDWVFDPASWDNDTIEPCFNISLIIGNDGCFSKLDTVVCTPDTIPEMVYYSDGDDQSPKAAKTRSQNTLDFSITPNPAADNVQISLSEDVSTSNVIVFDTQGTIITKFVMNADGYSLNTSDWKPGVYFVQVISENRKSVQKLVIAD